MPSMIVRPIGTAVKLAPAPDGGGGGPIPASPDAPRGDFHSVYEAFFHECCRWLFAMGVPESELEDVAQETFIAVRRKLAGFDGRNLGGWLYGIAWNKASEHRRTRWFKDLFRRRPGGPDHAWPDAAKGPVELLEQGEAARLIERALDGMSPKLRAAFVLVEIEGYQAAEVARLEGIPAETMRSRVLLSRAKFRALLHQLDPQGDRQ